MTKHRKQQAAAVALETPPHTHTPLPHTPSCTCERCKTLAESNAPAVACKTASAVVREPNRNTLKIRQNTRALQQQQRQQPSRLEQSKAQAANSSQQQTGQRDKKVHTRKQRTSTAPEITPGRYLHTTEGGKESHVGRGTQIRKGAPGGSSLPPSPSTAEMQGAPGWIFAAGAAAPSSASPPLHPPCCRRLRLRRLRPRAPAPPPGASAAAR